jgi:hypothetical protein
LGVVGEERLEQRGRFVEAAELFELRGTGERVVGVARDRGLEATGQDGDADEATGDDARSFPHDVW